jgi:hypothetical protein
LFIVAAGRASEPAAGGAVPRTLIVGVENIDYLPFYRWRAKAGYDGAIRTILDAFAKDRGYRLIYRAYPIRRLYAQLVTGRIDLKFPDNPEWAPGAKANYRVYYSNPILHFVDGTIVPSGHVGRGVAAIHTLGTLLGFTPVAWTGRIAAHQVTLRENPRLGQLLRQVVLGRVDGAYVNVAVARHLADALHIPPHSLAYDPALPHSNGTYRLSSAIHPRLIADFDAWLAAHRTLIREVERSREIAGVKAGG